MPFVRIGPIALLVVGLTACASPAARIAKTADDVKACQYRDTVTDTDYVDLAKKAGEKGGTHALVVREQPATGAFGLPTGGKEMVAEVYRCPSR